jgi:hypothetical protein
MQLNFSVQHQKSDAGQQGNLYSSHYKYIDAFEGSISDVELFRKAGILDQLDTGDMVMADIVSLLKLLVANEPKYCFLFACFGHPLKVSVGLCRT